jgi:anaerobic selenocysteine-containing dehydrogenase
MQYDRSIIKRTLCFGCWLQAGVLATVDYGKVIKLAGEPGHPVNQGWICERSKAFIEHLYHEDRLNYPLKGAVKEAPEIGKDSPGMRP